MRPLNELLVLTPLEHSPTRNVFRIDRIPRHKNPLTGVLHIAGGPYTGIIIRTLQQDCMVENVGKNLRLDFTVSMMDHKEKCIKQENRMLKFTFDNLMSTCEQHEQTQEFFKALLNDFPKDYVSFVKFLLKLMRSKFDGLKTLVVDMEILESKPIGEQPGINESIESITENNVKEYLEHAYPNGMLAEHLAKSLKCSFEKVMQYLEILKAKNLATRLNNAYWVRNDPLNEFEKSIVKQMPTMNSAEQPTVAIITAYFAEKLAIDAVIENKKTFVRYKTDGESNIYTLGNIGSHKVVSTKLSAVGCSRSASIAAGSVTTRLLGYFQEIQHVLIVGVGGAVLRDIEQRVKQQNQHQVKLGDVVLSFPLKNSDFPFSYVYCDDEEVNLDVNTTLIHGYMVKQWVQTSQAMIDAILELKREVNDERCPAWETCKKNVQNVIAIEQKINDASLNLQNFERPIQQHELLTLKLKDGQRFEHRKTGYDILANFEDGQTFNNDDGCRTNKNFSKLHLGPVGCGIMAKDPSYRLDFAEKFNLKCYDADFSTVIESILGNRINSWVLVRGISDFCDGSDCHYGSGLAISNSSSKTKQWQAYAAFQAALIAKMLIERLPLPSAVSGDDF